MRANSSGGQPSEFPTSDGLGADALLPGPSGQEAAGADVAAEICEHMGAVQVGEERRRFQRLPWLRLVPIWLAAETGSNWRIRKLDALIHDVCQGGLGLALGECLNPGTRLRAQFDYLPTHPVVTGVIRYCVQLGGGHHRIGVEFTK